MSRLTITTVITKTYTHSSSACGRVGARVKISHHGNRALVVYGCVVLWQRYFSSPLGRYVPYTSGVLGFDCVYVLFFAQTAPALPAQ